LLDLLLEDAEFRHTVAGGAIGYKELLDRFARVEEEVEGYGMPDIYFNNGRTTCIEIEMLFGRGAEPIQEMKQRLIDKKMSGSSVEQWIVMENYTMYRHLKELIRLWKELRKSNHAVRFFTLDVVKEDLIPLAKFARLAISVFKDAQEIV